MMTHYAFVAKMKRNTPNKIYFALSTLGVIMTKTNVSNTKFVESQFSKAYLHGKCIKKM